MRNICKNRRKCIAKRERIWYTVFINTGKLTKTYILGVYNDQAVNQLQQTAEAADR